MHSSVLTAPLLLTAVLAHMHLNSPATFGAANNPHLIGPADPELDYPFNCCGKQTPFPCRGYLKQLGTPQGAPVATWAAGSAQNFTLTGIGNHYGGSCQVGFSVDNGTTFQVAKSFEGNCPHRNGGVDPSQQTFNFTVPADMPTGNVVFAWTWFNREQEFNMNCAAVTITPSSNSPPNASHARRHRTRALPRHVRVRLDHAAMFNKREAAAASIVGAREMISYDQRPPLLIADADNGCETPQTTAEVKYPNPGPDVDPGDGVYPLALPTPAERCGY
ncbi:hypothetical protein MMC20_006329 [Loxospora ochrophaea]|nr:hypothetical protein [Loxospora ochrophaea]